MKKSATELTPTNLEQQFFSIYDWHYVVLGSDRNSPCTYYLGLGRHNVYRSVNILNTYFFRENVWIVFPFIKLFFFFCHFFRYEQNSWKIVQDTTLELTPNTLIYGEIVQERIGSGRSQIKSNYLHVIDGLFLGGEDIRHLHITERCVLKYKNFFFFFFFFFFCFYNFFFKNFF